jgi:hypothetical protein
MVSTGLGETIMHSEIDGQVSFSTVLIGSALTMPS